MRPGAASNETERSAWIPPKRRSTPSTDSASPGAGMGAVVEATGCGEVVIDAVVWDSSPNGRRVLADPPRAQVVHYRIILMTNLVFSPAAIARRTCLPRRGGGRGESERAGDAGR